jgi:hypothetical protein
MKGTYYMVDGIIDLRIQLLKIFSPQDSGDTLTIWDRYFFEEIDTSKLAELAKVFKAVDKLHRVIIYIQDKDDYYDYDCSTNDALHIIKKFNKYLIQSGIKLEVFGYDYYDDTNKNYSKINNQIDKKANRIHGRYWKTNSSGFLLDGSLNGIGENLCVGYIIDKDDFSKVNVILGEKTKSYCTKIELNK